MLRVGNVTLLSAKKIILIVADLSGIVLRKRCILLDIIEEEMETDNM